MPCSLAASRQQRQLIASSPHISSCTLRNWAYMSSINERTMLCLYIGPKKPKSFAFNVWFDTENMSVFCNGASLSDQKIVKEVPVFKQACPEPLSLPSQLELTKPGMVFWLSRRQFRLQAQDPPSPDRNDNDAVGHCAVFVNLDHLLQKYLHLHRLRRGAWFTAVLTSTFAVRRSQRTWTLGLHPKICAAAQSGASFWCFFCNLIYRHMADNLLIHQRPAQPEQQHKMAAQRVCRLSDLLYISNREWLRCLVVCGFHR